MFFLFFPIFSVQISCFPIFLSLCAACHPELSQPFVLLIFAQNTGTVMVVLTRLFMDGRVNWKERSKLMPQRFTAPSINT